MFRRTCRNCLLHRIMKTRCPTMFTWRFLTSLLPKRPLVFGPLSENQLSRRNLWLGAKFKTENLLHQGDDPITICIRILMKTLPATCTISRTLVRMRIRLWKPPIAIWVAVQPRRLQWVDNQQVWEVIVWKAGHPLWRSKANFESNPPWPEMTASSILPNSTSMEKWPLYKKALK